MKLTEIKNRIKNSVLFYEEDFCHIRNQSLEAALKRAVWNRFGNQNRKKFYIDCETMQMLENE